MVREKTSNHTSANAEVKHRKRNAVCHRFGEVRICGQQADVELFIEGHLGLKAHQGCSGSRETTPPRVLEPEPTGPGLEPIYDDAVLPKDTRDSGALSQDGEEKTLDEAVVRKIPSCPRREKGERT